MAITVWDHLEHSLVNLPELCVQRVVLGGGSVGVKYKNSGAVECWSVCGIMGTRQRGDCFLLSWISLKLTDWSSLAVSLS